MSQAASDTDVASKGPEPELEDNSNKTQNDDTEYPSVQKRILIMTSVYLSIFLVTLVGDSL